MRHNLTVISVILLFLAACSPPPIPQTATLLPLPTVDPNATPVPLAEINLEPLLIQPGDLPAGMSGGQVTIGRPPDSNKPGGVARGLPMSDNEIHQQFERNGESTTNWVNWVSVFLYKSNNDVTTVYDLIRTGFPGSWRSSDSAVIFEKKTLNNVGEKATIATMDDPIFSRLVDIVFVRCNAVVRIRMINSGRMTNRDQEIDVVATEAISYAKRLDTRLSQAVCR